MKKQTLFLKHLFLLVFAVASFTTVSAYTTVNSIAEIKALADGTEFIYEGEAITTLHLSRNNAPIPGIFVQDANDAIFLKHQYFMASNTWFEDPKYNGYKMNQGGTKVTSFSGKFKKASGTTPDCVEFTEDDMEYIESGTTDNPIPYAEITIDELLSNAAKYEYKAVKITNQVTKEGTGFYGTFFYFKSGDSKMSIHLSAQLDGRKFPAAGTFYGMVDKYGGNHQFLILDRYHIEPTAFFNIVDLYNFVDDKNKASIANTEIEIIEPVLVNYVANMPMNKNCYIQSTSEKQTAALCVTVATRNAGFSAIAGDSIVGLKGYYSKLSVVDGLYQGSMMRIQESNFSNIKVVSSNNPISWQEQKVYNILQTPSMFESRLISLPIGEFKNVKFVENGISVDRIAFVQYDGDLRKQYDTIRVQMAGGIDLTPYVGTKTAIMGIFDMSEAIAAGYPTILLRDEADILTPKTFASIGEMIAAGKPLSSKLTYEVTNPVVVTYKYYAANTMGDNEHMCGLYLQDATGAILYKTGQPVEGVEVGDSIKGLKGSFQYEDNVPGRQEHHIKGDASTKFTVLNSGNTLVPQTVTLDQIVNDPMAYANKYIKIENLETAYKFGFNQGYPYETEFVYQNGAMMNVVWDNVYENMTVTGVVEYGIMGYGLTILPDNIVNTVKAFDGTCTRIKDIKKLAAGTEFTYVGNATTTFTDYTNGILIQDHTGGILLKNAKLGDNGTASVKSGMVITNIKGKYQPASGDMMTSIEITDANVANITIKDAAAGFSCRATDVNVIKYFYSKYLVGEALMLRYPVIVEKENGYVITFSYYDSAGTETVVELPVVAKGDVDFTDTEFVGYARKFDGVLTFVIIGEGISAPPVDVENVEEKHFVFATSTEVIAEGAKSIEVYDVNGRVVAMAQSSTLNIETLNRGIYLVRTSYTDGSLQITKIIK